MKLSTVFGILSLILSLVFLYSTEAAGVPNRPNNSQNQYNDLPLEETRRQYLGEIPGSIWKGTHNEIRKLLNNVKRFLRRVGSLNYVVGLDQIGRIIFAAASVLPQNLNKGTATTAWARRQILTPDASVPGDHLGHIIASRLGGRGDDLYNLIAQSPNINSGVWREHEDSIYNAASRSGGTNQTIYMGFIYGLAPRNRVSQLFHLNRFRGRDNKITEQADEVLNPRKKDELFI